MVVGPVFLIKVFINNKKKEMESLCEGKMELSC